MSNDLVSIIVPVYNAEKYLDACISSILKQTYSRFELLLIVDGATDRSAFICREYEKHDTRITVIEKENEGGFNYQKSWNSDGYRGVYMFY